MSGYAIQRLTFSGMLDQSFRLLRDHFVPIAAPFIIAYVPYSVAMSAFGASQMGSDPTQLLNHLGELLIVLLVFTAVMPLAQLVVNYVIADAYLGKPTSARSAFKSALSTFLPYLGTSLLAMLALIPLFLLLCVPGLYFAVAWMMIGPVVVVEQVYGTKALKRSRELVKGHFWNTFAMILVATILVSLASGGLSIAFQFIPIVGPVLNGIVQAVTTAYMSAVLVVMYVDLRCRHEDFDLQLLAQQIARSTSVAPPAPTSPHAPAG
jgi:hypothetical protein